MAVLGAAGFAITQMGIGCMDCLDDVQMWRFDINFGQNRQEIYREDNSPQKIKYEEPNYYDEPTEDEYNWDGYDDGDGW